ncbi:MAG: response regulator transcription factor [Bacteroidota bacterium]
MLPERPSLLLIDEDEMKALNIKAFLEEKGYRVTVESSGELAYNLLLKGKFHLYLVNDELPGISGLDLAKMIRKKDFTTPVMIMSEAGSDKAKIEAFCAGGDDYIVKPFSNTELALRIYAQLRRVNPSSHRSQTPEMLEFGDFTFDYSNRCLSGPSGVTNLTKKESEVLRMLALNLNNVVKREVVLTDVWGENDYFMGRSMDVYIARLRKKLSDDRNVSIINVHRMGFKLEVRDQN